MADALKSLRSIFDEASDLPPGDGRHAYLDQACRGDAVLRGNVEELLRSDEAAGGFLADPRHDASANAVPIIEQEGDRIGRYKLLQKIGEGGCGVVYMAEQTEPVRRRVALKVIKLGMDTRSVIARFEAERQALAMMDHPNIARIFDAGMTGASDSSSSGRESAQTSADESQSRLTSAATVGMGRPYFVMELVRGIKITDYCEQNHLSTTERLQLFIQVCQAVQHAHQKGIIHRDLKPSNILVTSDDGVPLPKVIDFGIAKATADIQLTDKTLFTRFEMFIGTPAYMSPEQAEFNASDIDTRTDIYALGVLLYELLTGQTPFDGNELMSRGIDAMRRTIREKEPPKPSTRLTRELVAAGANRRQSTHGLAIPSQEELQASEQRRQRLKEQIDLLRGDLDWIILKSIEKDRTRRYETANGLAADLQRYLANEPVVARPPSTAYKIQKAWQRNKLAYTSAVVVALALVVGTGISTWQAVRATQAETLARERLTESEAITELFTGVFESPDPARDGRTITVVETLDRAGKHLDRDLAAQPARRARLQSTLGKTYTGLGMPLEAIPLLEQARDYYRSASRRDSADALTALSSLALAYGGVGRQQEALKLWEEVLPGRRSLLGPEHPDTLKTMEMLSFTYFNLGQQDEGIRLSEEELGLQRKVNGPEHLATLSAMNRLAFFYAKTGRPKEAIQLTETVLRIRGQKLGPDHADTLLAKARLAEVYGYADRRDESYKLFKEVLPLLRQKFGPDHPQTVNPTTHLGRWCSNWAWDGRGTNPAAMHELAIEGERLLRGALPVLESLTNAPPYHLACVRSRLGGAVSVAAFTDPALTPAAREQEMVEAETLMQLAQAAIAGDNLGCQRDAIERYIRLYEAWPKPEKVAEWKQKLADFDRDLANKKTARR